MKSVEDMEIDYATTQGGEDVALTSTQSEEGRGIQYSFLITEKYSMDNITLFVLDYEEVETLLYVEVDPSSMTEKQLRKEHNNLKIFGLDTKEPLMQVSDRFFQGKQQYNS